MPRPDADTRTDVARSSTAAAVALAEAAEAPVRDADLVRAGLRRGSADVLVRRGVLVRVGRGLFTTPAKAEALGLERFGASSDAAALARLRALRRPLTDQLLARLGLRHRAANLLRQGLLERTSDGLWTVLTPERATAAVMAADESAPITTRALALLAAAPHPMHVTELAAEGVPHQQLSYLVQAGRVRQLPGNLGLYEAASGKPSRTPTAARTEADVLALLRGAGRPLSVGDLARRGVPRRRLGKLAAEGLLEVDADGRYTAARSAPRPPRDRPPSRAERRAKALEVVRAVGGPATGQDLERAGFGRSMIRYLERAGLIVRVGFGKYLPAGVGEAEMPTDRGPAPS